MIDDKVSEYKLLGTMPSIHKPDSYTILVYLAGPNNHLSESIETVKSRSTSYHNIAFTTYDEAKLALIANLKIKIDYHQKSIDKYQSLLGEPHIIKEVYRGIVYRLSEYSVLIHCAKIEDIDNISMYNERMFEKNLFPICPKINDIIDITFTSGEGFCRMDVKLSNETIPLFQKPIDHISTFNQLFDEC